MSQPFVQDDQAQAVPFHNDVQVIRVQVLNDFERAGMDDIGVSVQSL
jgi:hypothetical protein